MKYPVAVLAVLSCVLACYMCADYPPFALSCQGTCYGYCWAVQTACDEIPGLNDICSEFALPCDAICAKACECFDGCQNKCETEADDCRAGNTTIVDFIECTANEVSCRSNCPTTCKFRLNGILDKAVHGEKSNATYTR